MIFFGLTPRKTVYVALEMLEVAQEKLGGRLGAPGISRNTYVCKDTGDVAKMYRWLIFYR